MNINDGNGLYDKYGLIDSIICGLNQIEVKGVDNMRIVFDSIGKLSALRNGLKNEEVERHADDSNQ